MKTLVLMLIAVVTIAGLITMALSTDPTHWVETVKTPSQARHIARQCVKIEDGHPSIKTEVYPLESPHRTPERFIVTCYK